MPHRGLEPLPLSTAAVVPTSSSRRGGRPPWVWAMPPEKGVKVIQDYELWGMEQHVTCQLYAENHAGTLG